MIKRVTEQKIKWMSIKDNICNEETIVKIYFLGILIIKRTMDATHDLNENRKEESKPGF